MESKKNTKEPEAPGKVTGEKHPLPGYPIYPDQEDIYKRDKEERDLDPEDVSRKKTPNEEDREDNEKDFEDDLSGGDLDVPGSELDDEQEQVGKEDEENEYFSLGGDDHENLDEDK
jgi:hypothetical protein